MTKQEIALRQNKEEIEIAGKQNEINLLVQAGIIPKGTPPEQVKLFALFCKKKGLDPITGQVFLMARRTYNKDSKLYDTKYSYQTGIQGYRITAERTGKYAGNDDYLFDEGLTMFQMLKENRQIPTTATATIYKLIGNQRVPYTASAYWDSYCPPEKQNFMWIKMPFLMLGKCAEALAFKKAFPDKMEGLYIHEEMQNAGEIIKEFPPPKKSQAEILEENPYQQIKNAKSVKEIIGVYRNFPEFQSCEEFRTAYFKRKKELEDRPFPDEPDVENNFGIGLNDVIPTQEEYSQEYSNLYNSISEMNNNEELELQKKYIKEDTQFTEKEKEDLMKLVISKLNKTKNEKQPKQK